MTIAWQEMVVRQTSTIDDMLRLLSDIGIEWFQVKFITAASEFISRMIFHINHILRRRAIERAQAKSIHFQQTYFREAIAIRIIGITIAERFIQSDAIVAVLGYERHIGAHSLFPRLAIHI